MNSDFRLTFVQGTLRLEGDAIPAPLTPFFRPHPNGFFIAPAHRYTEILHRAQVSGLSLLDDAAKFSPLDPDDFGEQLDPFDFQIEAIDAWERADRRGIVALPTGAGKSYLTRLLIATLAMRDSRCSALVVVPTRILLYQWQTQLRRAFRRPIGIVGDDLFDLQPVTVATYASARIHMPWFGDRWKLVVFDEVHRKLSRGPSGNPARFAVAPYRLGLTATPVEAEQETLEELVGPIVYRRTTEEMIERDVLAVYRSIRVPCKPAAEEVRQYRAIRRPMADFWDVAKRARRIQGDDWFAAERRLRPDAAALAQRAVLRAHRYWRSIPTRLERLRDILRRHRGDRVLIFAESRQSAYEISRQFLIPAITADIGIDERELYIGAFMCGQCGALVTARALEEGVDLPDANVAVILAGRKHRREETIQYIQRRGRVLRKRSGKQALVYEISWSLP